MGLIYLKDFLGERPLIHPTLLGPTEASSAINLRVETGSLKPLRGLTTIQAVTETGTITSLYRYGASTWLEWNTDVDVVGSLIANDSHGRIYYTGDSYPRFSTNTAITAGPAPYPNTSYRLGIPAPTACTAAINGVATDPSDLPETRFYVTTYVDAYGSEGPPSLPSNEVEWRAGQTVDLTSIPAAPVGDYNIANQYIYRVNTGSAGSVYQFVASIAVATTTYNDAIASENLGEALATTTYDPPPDDTMTGLVALPGEYMAAYYDNVLCFSEPGFPHAWPIEYQLTTDSPIKGIGAFGNSLLVTTEKNPYYVTGIHPGSVTMTKLELNQSCVSKDSVVDMGDTVMYASPDGLIAVGTNGVRKVTDKIFNREEWQKLTPSSIKAFYWEDMYIGFYDTGTTSGGFAVSPNKIDSGVIFFDTFATAGYSDLEEDILYLVTGSANTVLLGSIDATASTAVVGIGTAFTTELAVDDYILVSGETRKVTNIADDTNLTVDVAFTDTANDISPEKVNTHIVSWDTDASNPFSYTWASKPFITPVQTNFGVLQILADAYPISFRLVADGIVVRDGTANSEAPEFLPSGYLARNHEIEITGSTPVHQVIMANTMSELLKV